MQERQSVIVRSILVLVILVTANSASAYYSPRQGRWLSRDPIEEQGGRNLYAAMANSPASWFDPDGAEAATQPTSEPTVDNLDPGTNLGQAIAGASPHQTTCGIYVVRKTYAGVQWPGHTFIMWQGGSLGFSAGGKIISEQNDTVRALNGRKLAVSIYAVDYKPSEVGLVSYGHGNHVGLERAQLGYAYGAGSAKGTCCPDTPNCNDLIDCLASQVGTSVKGFEKNTVFTNPFTDDVNCNSFVRFALERCCLRRGKLVVNGYTGAFVKSHPVIAVPGTGKAVGFNFYDNEAGNLWGWNNGPKGYRYCGCSWRLR